MTKVPSVPYTGIVRALQTGGWTIVRHQGTHSPGRADTIKEVRDHAE